MTSTQSRRYLRLTGLAISLLICSSVTAQEHHHHKITAEQFAELREKVPLYQEYSDEQIISSMQRMGPNFQTYLSDSDTGGPIGILALGHGFRADGNEKFANAYNRIAKNRPTAIALGMAMMTSEHIQTAVDELTAAGAQRIVVMPVTTLRDGGLTGQWRYIFRQQDEAPWMSVPQVQTDAEIILTPTPSTGPDISAILLSNTQKLSQDPGNEVVALVAHGPDNEAANKLELEILSAHANYIKNNGGFAAVTGFTLQDDAPTAVRAANVKRLREWIKQATDSGQRAIVMTTLLFEGSVHEKLRRDLNGLDYRLSADGMLDNPLFSNWIDAQIAAAGKQSPAQPSER